MSGLVVVCGLATEARIARGTEGVAVIAGGGNAQRIARALDAASADAVLSFGIAGGLASNLNAGTVRVAETVALPNGQHLTPDPRWSMALSEALAVPLAIFAGSDAPVVDPSTKAALHRATGAELVDMESHHAAAWAVANGARFAALRVVTDSAIRALPHAAAVGMRADGETDLAAILRSLARNPAQLPALIRTGLDARAAFAALLRCRQRLGPRFALLDLG